MTLYIVVGDGATYVQLDNDLLQAKVQFKARIGSRYTLCPKKRH